MTVERDGATPAPAEALAWLRRRPATEATLTDAVVACWAQGVGWSEIATVIDFSTGDHVNRKYAPMLPADRAKGPGAAEQRRRASTDEDRRRAMHGLVTAYRAWLMARWEKDTVKWIARARTERATWDEIAEAMGMQKTYVATKYGPKISERRTYKPA